MPEVHIILLSGGSGSRLWPLSNSTRSKQFLKVLKNEDGTSESMVQRVFAQILRSRLSADITIATGASQEDAIRSQLSGSYQLVLEPERRDTAAAIMLACSHLASCQGADSSDTVIVMPIDTFADQCYYDSMCYLDRAVRSEEADLVLLGVEPFFPSEKYGYIVPTTDAKADGAVSRDVKRFCEKPGAERAAELIAEGALWNCGVFAFRLGWITHLIESNLGSAEFEAVLNGYRSLPEVSFDYAVVEKASSISVVPYSGTWKDLGTWNTLAEEMTDNSCGRVVMAECPNVHVINETGLPMVVSGLSNAVVVATPDGILACSKEATAHIKELVAQASEARPMYEKRRWGEYRVLDSDARSEHEALTKELLVTPGAQLSYQRHEHRREIWTIIAGWGEVVLDGEAKKVGAGSVVSIDPGVRHAVRANEAGLRIIEVQLGSPLVEEDIERFGEWWS